MESALNKSDEAEVVVEATARRFGQVDGLVSCAGGSYTGLLTEITDEAWAQCINQNLSTQFFILKAVLENAKRASQGCSVVLIGSKTAVAPGLGFGAYAIAKAGVVQLGRIAALEGGKFGVRVNTVNPGAIFEGSQFWSPELVHERARLNGVPPETLEHHYSSRNALQRRVTTRDVAETVIFLLSQRSSATTGCILTVDGGDEHAFPR
jgi:NAD(P)-dependent dehydrogenase (short-subunit alcohol dehydrogenase family)